VRNGQGEQANVRTRHFPVGDGIAKNLGQVEEDAASLVKDLDARLDLEVFAHGGVEGM